MICFALGFIVRNPKGRTLHEYNPSSSGKRDTQEWSLPERSGTVGLTTSSETVVLALEGKQRESARNGTPPAVA